MSLARIVTTSAYDHRGRSQVSDIRKARLWIRAKAPRLAVETGPGLSAVRALLRGEMSALGPEHRGAGAAGSRDARRSSHDARDGTLAQEDSRLTRGPA